MQSYPQELSDLHHRRAYYILFAVSSMILLFSILDSIIASEYFTEFLVYRVAVALVAVALLVVNFRDRSHSYALLLGFIGYLCCSLAIVTMIHRMGGVTSPYYVGLIITITIYSTLAPLNLLQTLSSGFILISFYIITILFTNPLSPSNLIEFITNLFFLICFVFIIATQSWVDIKAHKREYRLRREENMAADELAGQAVILEEEVLKRSKEQAASEERYHRLFDQIADDVVVIDQNGIILQLNSSFENHYADKVSLIGLSFFDLTLEGQEKNIKQTIAEMVAGKKPLSACQLCLKKKDKTVIDAEINGNPLLRDDMVVGLLLIIRDISTRKKLAQKLIQSLAIKKKTETAAILALAKLSEFKDVMADNHLERIREYCKILGTELSTYAGLQDVITSAFMEDIYYACILHDIGKVAIPDKLLGNKTSLKDQELDQIRKHTIIGGDIIKEMEEESEGSGFLSMAKHIAYFHHERWDGTGYPYGLMTREIPLAARIMAVADTYEEMTAGTGEQDERVTHEDAVVFIENNKGHQFDPVIVEAFLAKQHECNAVRQKFAEVEGQYQP
jgi:PAS domain S-box-containing protein